MAKTAPTPALPADIRLMNLTAALLAAIGLCAIVVVLSMWLMRLPLFAVQSIRVEGDLTHNSA